MAKFKFEDGSELGNLGREIVTIVRKTAGKVSDIAQEVGKVGWMSPEDKKAVSQEIEDLWTKAREEQRNVYLKMIDLLDESSRYVVYSKKSKKLGELIEASNEWVQVNDGTGELFKTYEYDKVLAFLKI